MKNYQTSYEANFISAVYTAMCKGISAITDELIKRKLIGDTLKNSLGFYNNY